MDSLFNTNFCHLYINNKNTFVSLLMFCSVQILTPSASYSPPDCEDFAGVLPFLHSSCSLSHDPLEVSLVLSFLR